MMLPRKATGREIATALGVSPQRVSQLRRDGMPDESIDAAAAWFRRRVDPARSAAQRYAREARPAPPPRPDARPPVLALVARLVPAAEAEYARGAPGTDVALLRAALAQVPAELRRDVMLPLDLARALTADVFAVVTAFEPARPAGAAAPEINDKDAAWLGAFWYGVMADEIRAVPVEGAT